MHCRACDDLLNDREATRKDSITGEYFDLCDKCFISISGMVEAQENPLFENEVSIQQENENVGESENLTAE